MKITLPNGLILEGELEQIKDVASKLGVPLTGSNTHYFSESHGGFIKITDMQTNHLRNSILKMYKEWINSLYDVSLTPRQLYRKLYDGPSDQTLVSMVRELNNRL